MRKPVRWIIEGRDDGEAEATAWFLTAQPQPHAQGHRVHMMELSGPTCCQASRRRECCLPTSLRLAVCKTPNEEPRPPFLFTTLSILHSTRPADTTHPHHPCPSPHTHPHSQTTLRCAWTRREQPAFRRAPPPSQANSRTNIIIITPSPFFVAPRPRAQPASRNHGDPHHGQGRGVEEQRG